MSHERLWFFLIVGIAVLLGAAILGLSWPGFYAAGQQQGPNLEKLLGRQDFGGEFALVNQDGVLTESASFSGQYKLIYFGFTYCPQVCPTTLKKMTDALNMLDGQTAEKIVPVFITVAPQRDTPKVIKSYISMFHPRFTGFTGTKAQINRVLERYRVFAQETQKEALTQYGMNHTSFIYLTDPGDRVIAVFTPTQDAKDIAVSLAGILG